MGTIRNMSPVQPGSVQQSEVSDDDAIRVWLDALASGKWNESAFLQAVQERFRSDPEANWEVLSQLDQYFRRGKIPAEIFRTVKTALAESALRVINPARESAAAPMARSPEPAAAIDTETRSIPIARDIVARAEHTDIHQRREGTQSLEAPGEPKPGSVLRRRYRLETIVGQSGTGPVFQAVDEYRLESPGSQRLAIKILHPAVVKRAELLAELRREFQTLQLLSHPNIVRVFEFDRDGSLVFFTMELLTGATLSRVLQARKLIPLPRDEALAAIRDIGAALAYAHSRNIFHGDIRPRSVFVTSQGDLRITGFPGSVKARENSSGSDHELTLPIATSGYASCQVLEGERPEARDDLFSLACIVYLLLSGEHPLKQKTALEAREAGIRIRRPAGLNYRQWQSLRAGLRWEREGRPGDIEQWLRQFDLSGAAKRLRPLPDLVEPPAQKNPRTSWLAVAAVGAVVLLGAAYWFISQRGMLPRLEAISPSRAPNSAITAAEPAFDAGSQTAVSPPSSPPVRASVAVPTGAVAVIASTPAVTASTTPAANPASAPAANPASAPAANSASASPRVVAPQPASLLQPQASLSSPAPAVALPGSSRVELSADTVDVPPGEQSAQVSVRRKGSLRGETSFTWWTESGTAKPGVDFSAVVPQIAHIADGKSSVNLTVALSNAPHAQPKSFYVMIDQTEGGAALAGRTLTMVTLQTAD
jgi:serine/threonine protein kinase